MSAVRIFAVTTLIASFGVWAYAYSGLADREAPDTLDDADYARAADAICDRWMVAFDAMPNAEAAADNVERAQQIRDRNVVLDQMLDDLEQLETTTDRDTEMTTEWVGDWRQFVAEREDYADRFELDDSAQFYVSAIEGERLEKRITRFATTNLMFSCSTPSDVG